MSLKKYNGRVKATQKIIDDYLSTVVVIGSHDPFTMIDSLRQSLGCDCIFGDFSDLKDAETPDLAKFLSGKLPEIARLSAIVGDIVAINNGDKYAVGVCLGYDYSIFADRKNTFSLVSNKLVTNAWRLNGES